MSTGQRVCSKGAGELKWLRIDLTRLKDDAASVTNPSLSSLQAIANVVIRHYVFIVTWFLQC